MRAVQHRQHRRGGFTLLELMIAVAIIGILSAAAIAGFRGYQMRSKLAEGKTSVASIRVVQKAYHAEHGVYLAAPSPSPGLGTPGPAPQDWRTRQGTFDSAPGNAAGTFEAMGWEPDGPTYHDYVVYADRTADGARMTVAAFANTDGDGAMSAIMYVQPDGAGNQIDCALCDDAGMTPFDLRDCRKIYEQVAQVPPDDRCGYPVADDF